jgi:hypothetical protein
MIFDSGPYQVEGLVKDEIEFLEFLAFTRLDNDVIDFDSRHRTSYSHISSLPR